MMSVNVNANAAPPSGREPANPGGAGPETLQVRAILNALKVPALVFTSFRRDGSLIDEVGVTGVGTQSYAFAREGGVHDIAGIAIFNNDLGGVGFDNFIHDVPGVSAVPAPASAILLVLGLAAAGGIASRKVLR